MIEINLNNLTWLVHRLSNKKNKIKTTTREKSQQHRHKTVRLRILKVLSLIALNLINYLPRLIYIMPRLVVFLCTCFEIDRDGEAETWSTCSRSCRSVERASEVKKKTRFLMKFTWWIVDSIEFSFCAIYWKVMWIKTKIHQTARKQKSWISSSNSGK